MSKKQVPATKFNKLQKVVANYDKEYVINGASEELAKAYYQAALTAFAYADEGEPGFDKIGLQICKRAKGALEKVVQQKTTGNSMWDLEKYCFRTGENYDVLDLYYEILLVEAQHKQVDSYFRYLEKKRPPEERFYMPRRNVFLKHGITQALQGLIDDEYDILCVSLIPGAGKTTVEKFFHSAVIGWFPNDYNLFYSHSGDITRMYYDGMIDIVTNDDEYTWNEIFPYLGVTSQNAKLEQFNVGKYKPFQSVQCTSVGAKNAGKVRASRYLLVDDMIGGIEEALNKNILEKLWNDYTVDARQRKVQSSDGTICKEIHFATRWSVWDVIGRIIDAYGEDARIKVISVPDVDENGKSNFDYEVGGFTEKFFEDQAKLMDEITYNCLYKQQPIEREGLLYHDEELKRYSSLPIEEPDAIIGVCDTKSKGTDLYVLPVMYQYGDMFYMEDCICNDTSDYEVQYSETMRMITNHNMQKIEFESNAGGDRISHEIQQRCEKIGQRCNITSKATETHKETRIIVNAEWVKKHIYFKDRENYGVKSQYAKFMNYLLSYTVSGKNKHDDVPDALANFALFVNERLYRRATIVMPSLL